MVKSKVKDKKKVTEILKLMNIVKYTINGHMYEFNNKMASPQNTVVT